MEKSTSEDFEFLKCDISKSENMKEAVKVGWLPLFAYPASLASHLPCPWRSTGVTSASGGMQRSHSLCNPCTVGARLFCCVCVCVWLTDENGQPTLRVCEDGGHWHWWVRRRVYPTISMF